MQSPGRARPCAPMWYSVMPNMVNSAPKVTLPFSSQGRVHERRLEGLALAEVRAEAAAAPLWPWPMEMNTRRARAPGALLQDGHAGPDLPALPSSPAVGSRAGRNAPPVA